MRSFEAVIFDVQNILMWHVRKWALMIESKTIAFRPVNLGEKQSRDLHHMGKKNLFSSNKYSYNEMGYQN